MGDHYILPGEFAALVLFWFGLPLLLAFVPLAWLFASRGLFREHTSRALGAFVLTIVLSIAVGLGILIWSPPFLKFLGVRDFFFAGQYWPVLPLSFVAVAVVSPIVGWWALRAARPNIAVKRDAPQAARPLP
jgi:NhaP-type Na+/H+ and K+/H+ antiporter